MLGSRAVASVLFQFGTKAFGRAFFLVGWLTPLVFAGLLRFIDPFELPLQHHFPLKLGNPTYHGQD
jgi:hypothetical protein